MKKHSFKKSGTNLYKNGAGGGSKAIYKLYKKTDVLETGVVPKLWSCLSSMDDLELPTPVSYC